MSLVIDFGILGLVYMLFFYRKWRKLGQHTFLLKTSMYLYICMVLFVTLMPFHVPIPGGNRLFLESANLIPFRDVREGYLGAKREVLLNVIMTVPFGLLLPLIKKRSFLKVVAWTFLFSLMIESMQLMYTWAAIHSSRSFDVTDLITNTTGGFIGYCLYRLLLPFLKK